MSLGMRGLSPEMQLMNSHLRVFIRTGIDYGFFPESFESISNPIADYNWRDAVQKTEDFEFMTLQEYVEEKSRFNISKENLYKVATNNAVWQSKDFQEFMNLALFVQLLYIPELSYAFLKTLEAMIYERAMMNEATQKEVARVTNLDLTNMNGLSGGKIADESTKSTWVKPVVILGVIGAIAGIGFWKKDEIMQAVKGEEDKKPKKVEEKKEEKQEKDESINGVGKSKKGKKALGKTPNKGLQKMLAINKSAKSLQNQSGYEMRDVKDVEVKTVRKSMPKLSWKEAQKRAKNLYKNR